MTAARYGGHRKAPGGAHGLGRIARSARQEGREKWSWSSQSVQAPSSERHEGGPTPAGWLRGRQQRVVAACDDGGLPRRLLLRC